MSKSWFLDYLGKSVVKSRVRAICELMELTDSETLLVLDRFCDRKIAGQCHEIISEDLQKKMLPSLDRRVRGWVEANIAAHSREFAFAPDELAGIFAFKIDERRAVD